MIGDDPLAVRRFLADYRDSAGRLAEELRAAHASNDHRRLGAVAHRLKSSSRSIGALVLDDLCAEMENACRTGASESMAHGMSQFEGAFSAVNAQIAQGLESQPAYQSDPP